MSDTASSIDFFARLLDLEAAMDLGWVATMSPADRPDRQLTLITADATAIVNPHISVDVEDLGLVWRRAREIGADIVYERTTEPWGVERFFVRDPDGNVINVLSHSDAASTGT